MEWHKISELPQPGTEVLVFCKDDLNPEGWYEIAIVEDGQFVDHNEEMFLPHVVCWTLPPKPEGV